MLKQLLRSMVFCAACLALAAQAQYSGSSSSSSQTPGQGSQSGWTGRHYGSMQHQDVKASQLNGAQIQGSSGESLGTISDCIVDANSGRIVCAIVSLSGSSSGSSTTPGNSGSATSPSGSATGSSSSDTTPGSSSSATSPNSSSASGKQVAVPWMLLRPASTAGATTGTLSFNYKGDATKLQSAPTFDSSTDLSQGTWRQQVFSYFGITPGSGAGGAESPGGSSSSGSQPYTPK